MKETLHKACADASSDFFGRLRAKPSGGLYAVFPFLLYAENRTYLCPFKDNLQEHMQNIQLGMSVPQNRPIDLCAIFLCCP